jgi:hypothetical protein
MPYAKGMDVSLIRSIGAALSQSAVFNAAPPEAQRIMDGSGSLSLLLGVISGQVPVLREAVTSLSLPTTAKVSRVIGEAIGL